jgi:hypothetical protein
MHQKQPPANVAFSSLPCTGCRAFSVADESAGPAKNEKNRATTATKSTSKLLMAFLLTWTSLSNGLVLMIFPLREIEILY